MAILDLVQKELNNYIGAQISRCNGAYSLLLWAKIRKEKTALGATIRKDAEGRSRYHKAVTEEEDEPE